MSNVKSLCAVVAAALACAVLGPAVVRADDAKHDSNTLHKIGKAIAYPVKKAAGNASKPPTRPDRLCNIRSARPVRTPA